MGTALKILDPIAFNQEAEVQFLQVFWNLLEEFPDGVPANILVAEAAYKLDVSPMTIKRYVLKYSAPSAPLILSGRLVKPKPDTDRVAHPDAHAHPRPGPARANEDGHPDAVAHADAEPDAHSDPYSGPDPDAVAYPDGSLVADVDPHTDAYARSPPHPVGRKKEGNHWNRAAGQWIVLT
ncbi:MAG: hypothetical protein ACPLYD_13005, partial [Anaerolineae bacterium]